MENERGKAIIENYCAAVLADPRFKTAMGMTLKQIRPMSGGKVTQDMIKGVSQDLAELPKPKCNSCGEELSLTKGPAGPTGPKGPAGPSGPKKG
ncbi:hypothetical protein [Desulfosarcina ovata]|nr:hypothetical protein [Desulfosarcina ovata]